MTDANEQPIPSRGSVRFVQALRERAAVAEQDGENVSWVWLDVAADEIERLRGLIDNAARLMEGSPVGSGCYEARRILTGGK
jgi:hypothetical protein